jgi:hypothetical protein
MGRIRNTWDEAKRETHIRENRVRYEISWQQFENRERWRSLIPVFNSLGAAQLLKLKRDHRAAYDWFQRNA